MACRDLGVISSAAIYEFPPVLGAARLYGSLLGLRGKIESEEGDEQGKIMLCL